MVCGFNVGIQLRMLSYIGFLYWYSVSIKSCQFYLLCLISYIVLLSNHPTYHSSFWRQALSIHKESWNSTALLQTTSQAFQGCLQGNFLHGSSSFPSLKAKQRSSPSRKKIYTYSSIHSFKSSRHSTHSPIKYCGKLQYLNTKFWL